MTRHTVANFRAFVAAHPLLYSAAVFLIGVVLLAVILPRNPGQSSNVVQAVVVSAAGVAMVNLVRVSSNRIRIWILVALGVCGIALYGNVVRTHGFPVGTSERVYFALVVAVPIAALVLAVWLWIRGKHTPMQTS